MVLSPPSTSKSSTVAASKSTSPTLAQAAEVVVEADTAAVEAAMEVEEVDMVAKAVMEPKVAAATVANKADMVATAVLALAMEALVAAMELSLVVEDMVALAMVDKPEEVDMAVAKRATEDKAAMEALVATTPLLEAMATKLKVKDTAPAPQELVEATVEVLQVVVMVNNTPPEAVAADTKHGILQC